MAILRQLRLLLLLARHGTPDELPSQAANIAD
jgi:hypothetical protein